MKRASFFLVLGLICAQGISAEPAIPPAQGTASTAQPAAAKDISSSGAGHYAKVHGLKMYYEIHGQGEPLLLLHGGLSSIPVWPEAIEYFSRNYQVIAPEQMGHGRTADDPARLMDYHAMAEDTAELLRQLNVKEVLILGWSDGGILGFDLAINHPRLVKKLAVSGASYLPSKPDKPTDTVKPLADRVPRFIRDPYERLSPDGAAHWPVFVERLQKMWETQPNFTPGQLGAISAPTLVIAGDRDFYTPEYTTRMWRSIPNARLWIAPNSTHGLPKQGAALFNQVVGDFFKEPAPGSGSPGAALTP
jgi:pimeloyl-ACP methyl ester carboxylesterase